MNCATNLRSDEPPQFYATPIVFLGAHPGHLVPDGAGFLRSIDGGKVLELERSDPGFIARLAALGCSRPRSCLAFNPVPFRATQAVLHCSHSRGGMCIGSTDL